MQMNAPLGQAFKSQTKSHDPAVALVLREARRLHRAARSASLCACLPVLRRVLAAQVVPGQALTALLRHRAAVQRKHLLHMLAVEAGHRHWQAYRSALADVRVADLAHFAVEECGHANLNLWFASELAAQRYAAEHGGRSVRVGRQAVVLPNVSVAECRP
jgi:hypothetical protein